MAADGTLKLDYASVVFVDSEVQILFPQLLPDRCKVSGSSRQQENGSAHTKR